MAFHKRNLTEEEMAIEGKLKQNALYVKELYEIIKYGDASLKDIPTMIKRVIQEKIWRSRIEYSELIEFDTFEEFVTTPLPEGLGATIKQLEALCGNDIEAQRMIQAELKKGPGAPEGNTNNRFSNKDKDTTIDIIQDCKTKAPTGTSRAAGIRRLEKDRPDLLADVETGKMSVNQAMVDAGFRKKTVTITVDVEVIARKLLRTLNQDEIHHLIQLLQQPHKPDSRNLDEIMEEFKPAWDALAKK